MINIAICDDDCEFLNFFEKELESIFGLLNEDIHIKKYYDSLKFVKMYEKNFYNIVFLDICMPNINGLEVAEKIRKVDKNVEIVFVTFFEKCVYRSFKFRPFRFIRKNKIKDELENVIKDFIDYKKRDIENLAFKIKDGFINLNKDEILYFDVENRKIKAHTEKHIYHLTNLKFNDIVEKLEDNGFIQVHRGYLVNIKYIKEYKKSTIRLTNEEYIPVSRYKINEVEQLFNIF